MKHSPLSLARMLTLRCTALLVLAGLSSHAAELAKYNVLFIASDDLRPALGCYGFPLVQTPNLDRLASQGVRFDRAYCQYALCNPSRTSMLTGRHPTTTGVMGNREWFGDKHPDWISLPRHFKNNGIPTLRAGKIFHGGIDDTDAWTEGGEARRFGGAEDAGDEDNAQPARTTGAGRATPANAQANRGAAGQRNRGGQVPSQSDRIIMLDGNGESNGDYRTATRAIEYLEKHKTQQFFMAVGFAKPHSPPTAPRKFFDLYDPAKITLPPDFATTPAALPGFPDISVARRNTDLFIGREASPEAAREMIRAYLASVTFMDTQVGRVLDALDRLKLREKTIVVFFGDHGYHLGEKGKWSKAYSIYEVAARAPFIIALPRAKGQVCLRTVQLLDLYPTLVELCGLPNVKGLEGHSLTPLLKNPQSEWNHPAYTVVQYQNVLGKSVRTERWRYAEWDDGKKGTMLIDHDNDPNELKNLSADPAYAKTVEDMKLLLKVL